MKREIYNKLIEWKNNNINMPFMLVGARQTGKTYILNEFCNNEFEKNLYINLDKSEDIREIFEETLEPDTIIQNIEALKNISIDINNTIVFLDEIQVSERAIINVW